MQKCLFDQGFACKYFFYHSTGIHAMQQSRKSFTCRPYMCEMGVYQITCTDNANSDGKIEMGVDLYSNNQEFTASPHVLGNLFKIHIQT